MAKGQIEGRNRTCSGMVADLEESTRPGGMSGEEEGS